MKHEEAGDGTGENQHRPADQPARFPGCPQQHRREHRRRNQSDPGRQPVHVVEEVEGVDENQNP